MLFNTELASRTTWREFGLVLRCFNCHLASNTVYDDQKWYTRQLGFGHGCQSDEAPSLGLKNTYN